ncbi:hypothetical protein K3U93_07015 [Mycobacterium malmoense]|uniref:Uncharacterized protein n=1 Tax=Mycobacterium malmoense TaxID=1780 RepID=A0ABX3SVU1_MYCMA|nr:hypothetical protein [Mycobacterium malmoense]OIN82176.1 hypothetical protein BMG05_03740 [Mycobacterium malmoense]ORA83786.1 hypothetical protein BST29_09705 [Mycobacterium malmoense]QZA18901.1 hypothetical protein K3U93_07015 [Mycobacterium malmoense]UNB95670.1 hypothetical protein H5T25_07010 [Mycobacterium malmoense]
MATDDAAPDAERAEHALAETEQLTSLVAIREGAARRMVPRSQEMIAPNDRDAIHTVVYK